MSRPQTGILTHRISESTAAALARAGNTGDLSNSSGWSYTVGVFDTSGRPEIITVGLLPETAHFALNEAAMLLRAGVDLTKGRHSNLIGQVDCEFRSVDSKWVEHLMGWALWYYDGDDFPV